MELILKFLTYIRNIMKKAIKRQILTITLFLFCVLFSYSQESISGKILYHNDENKPIEDVTVTLSDIEGNIVATEVSDEDGEYEFENITDGEYLITASTEIEAGGIDLEDAFLLLLYIQGYQPLDTLAIMAGDVNGDGELNNVDIDEITTYWYLYGQPFPAGDWVFGTLYIIIDEGKSKNVGGPNGGSTGDVNGSYDPGNKIDPYVNLISNISQDILVDNEYTFPINIEQDIEISSMGLSFEYPADLIEITNVTSAFADINFSTLNNELKISWLDLEFSDLKILKNESIVNISFKVKSNFTSNKRINFTINDESHFVDLKGIKIPEVTLNMPKFNVISSPENNVFNFPNPFENFTTIQYELISDAKVSLKVVDLTGHEVFNLPESFISAGIQTIKFDGSSLGSGIYFYNLSVKGTSNFTENGSMIIKR